MLIAIAIAITSAIVCDLLLMLEAAKQDRAHIFTAKMARSVPEHRPRRKKYSHQFKGGKKRAKSGLEPSPCSTQND